VARIVKPIRAVLGCCVVLGGHERLPVAEPADTPRDATSLAPDVVHKMVKEMEQLYAEHLRQTVARAEKAPKELQELTARIERLRARLKTGDEDMSADELQAAIDKAEGKRQELEQAQPVPRLRPGSSPPSRGLQSFTGSRSSAASMATRARP